MFDRNFWINGLRIIAWIVFAIIILSSIILGFASNSFGLFFVYIISGFVIAFLSVASIMIFLNAAEDIAEIKYKLYEDETTEVQTSVMRKALRQQEIENHEKQILANKGWKCSACGKANPQTTGTCSCGNSKYN